MEGGTLNGRLGKRGRECISATTSTAASRGVGAQVKRMPVEDDGALSSEEHPERHFKRQRDNKSSFASKFETDRETDEHRINQRQKQIDFGKNTIGYDRYIATVPRHKRRRGDPQTPDVHAKMSKRAFQGLVKKWRRELHKWDPVQTEEEVQAVTATKSNSPSEKLPEKNTKTDESSRQKNEVCTKSSLHMTEPLSSEIPGPPVQHSWSAPNPLAELISEEEDDSDYELL